MKHVDVGEKIGGARKDFYARSLNVADYEVMNEDERKVFVVKKNIFPPYEFKKWRGEGMTPQVGMFLKLFRQTLPNDPKKFCQEVSPHEEAIKQWISALNKMDAVLTGRGVGGGSPPYTLRELVGRLQTLTTDWVAKLADEPQTPEQRAVGILLHDMYVWDRKNNMGDIIRQVAMLDIDHFQRLTSDSSVRDFAAMSEEDRLDSVCRAVDNLMERRLGMTESAYKTVDSKVQAACWNLVSKSHTMSQEIKDKIREAKERQELWHRPHLDHVVVSGQRRSPQRHVTADELMREFGFRGVEFGNWLPDDERQDVLDFAYDSFDQLAAVLQVPRKAIGLEGSLAIAFGSRGHGGKNAALAHYEPLRKVINLTRIKGAGSLAHEWFHAFDHANGWASENVADVWAPMLERHLNTEEIAKNAIVQMLDGIHKITRGYPTAGNRDLQATFHDLLGYSQRLCETVRFDVLKSGMAKNIVRNPEREPWWNGWRRKELNKLANLLECRYGALKNTVLKGVVVADLFHVTSTRAFEAGYKLAAWSAKVDLDATEKTKFYRDALKLDQIKGGKTYWAKRKEMYARAGAAYVHDQLAAREMRNDYLEYGAGDARYVESTYSPNPCGPERQQIAAMFDQQLDQWREKVKSLECEPIVKNPIPHPVQTDPGKVIELKRTVQVWMHDTCLSDMNSLRIGNQAEEVGGFAILQNPLVLSVATANHDLNHYIVQTFDDSSIEQGGIVEYQILPTLGFGEIVKNGRLMMQGERISALTYEMKGNVVPVKKEDDAVHYVTNVQTFRDLARRADESEAVVWMNESVQQRICELLEANECKIAAAASRRLELVEKNQRAGRRR